MKHIADHVRRVFSVYLNGGVARGWGNEAFLESQDELLLLGYDRVGSTGEHSLLEKYYPVSLEKGVNFKLYFHKGDLWSSGVDFFGFRLEPLLKLVKEHINKVDVFFDVDDFDNGALVVNDFCVCRFSFMNERSPRILTLETDMGVCASMQGSRVATDFACKQFVHVKDVHVFRNNRNVRRIFEIMRKTCHSQVQGG